jgi:hypothetical protein
VSLQPAVTFDIGGVDLRVDGRVLVFAAFATLLTVAACGLVPALRASRPNPDTGLRAATSGTGRRSGLLVVRRGCLSIVLLVGPPS